MKNDEVNEIEIDLLLTALLERYGYDFRNYSRASIKRRILHISRKNKYGKISEMIPRLLHDESFGASFVHDLSITVTEMFRDPDFFAIMRKKVIPFLKTYPFIKVWHAGCATGEEVYSMAILLKEEGMSDCSTLFGTDLNDFALKKAMEGIYSIKNAPKCTRNYQAAGGRSSFSKYYYSQYESIILDQALKKNMVFANHNLVTDAVFGEMHLIVCRNTLIYFNQTLQNRVISLFKDSLVHGGVLALGSRETIRYSGFENDFKEVDAKWKIYQKLTR